MSQRFAHGEPPSHRHLQQVIDEAHSWGGNETEKDFQKEDLLTGATQWRTRRITGLKHDTINCMCGQTWIKLKKMFKTTQNCGLTWQLSDLEFVVCETFNRESIINSHHHYVEKL